MTWVLIALIFLGQVQSANVRCGEFSTKIARQHVAAHTLLARENSALFFNCSPQEPEENSA